MTETAFRAHFIFPSLQHILPRKTELVQTKTIGECDSITSDMIGSCQPASFRPHNNGKGIFVATRHLGVCQPTPKRGFSSDPAEHGSIVADVERRSLLENRFDASLKAVRLTPEQEQNSCNQKVASSIPSTS